MVYLRKRGAVIVNTPNGILLVSGNRGKFYLPGGKANHRESRKIAGIRELKEETNLKGIESTFLFHYIGKVKKNYSGRDFRDDTKVFLVKAKGKIKPKHEIKKIGFYKQGKKIKIDHDTTEIIKRFNKLVKKR